MKKKTNKTKAKQTNKITLKLVVVRLLKVQIRDFVFLVDNVVLWKSSAPHIKQKIQWTVVMNVGNHLSLTH